MRDMIAEHGLIPANWSNASIPVPISNHTRRGSVFARELERMRQESNSNESLGCCHCPCGRQESCQA